MNEYNLRHNQPLHSKVAEQHSLKAELLFICRWVDGLWSLVTFNACPSR